jgi:hypothetical protein
LKTKKQYLEQILEAVTSNYERQKHRELVETKRKEKTYTGAKNLTSWSIIKNIRKPLEKQD